MTAGVPVQKTDEALLLGIDLGTTGCKCMAFAGDGGILADAYYECGLITLPGGAVEQDAEEWWTLVCRAVHDVVAALGSRAGAIRALAVSSQGISFVPVDGDGVPMRRAISWLDSRAVDETEQLRRLWGEQRVFRITGKRVSAAYTLPKLIWLARHEPDIYRKAAYFLLPQDFIALRLCGIIATDYSLASGTMMFDVTRRRWDDELLAIAGIGADRLPEPGQAGTPLGRILPEIARSLGLPSDCTVALGGQDQKCAAIGADIGLGIATVSLGTAAAISQLTDHPALDDERRIPLFALDDRSWILEAVIGTACLSLKWLRQNFFADLSYEAMDQLAAQSQPGAGGCFFYPHLSGSGSPLWNSSSAGSFTGLRLATGRPDFIRAVLEGVAYQIRLNLETLRQVNPEPISQLRLFGGGANSRLWSDLIAQISGLPTAVLYTAEMANLGAATLAGRSVGLTFSGRAGSDGEASGDRLIARVDRPDPTLHLRYSELYRLYLSDEQTCPQGPDLKGDAS